VGGCCGTTPQHIGAIHDEVASQAPRAVGRQAFYKEADERLA
jgi:5-methyltetrahydrofolate--homocysteine methyltransferase